MLTLGWAGGAQAKPLQRKMAEFARYLGRLAKIELGVRAFDTYDDLTQSMARGEIDLAWLPPLCFVALASQGHVAALASVRSVPYRSAIIVAADSPIKSPRGLWGLRAAWVDRYSASGFVLPRIKLGTAGLDPCTAFSFEKFCGAHEAVVAAILAREVDFGATWAHATPPRNVSGPWSRTPGHEAGVRVLSLSGSVPPDVITARADLAKTARKAIVASLKTIYDEKQSRWLVRDVFGTEAFYRPDLALYDALRDTVTEAFEAGWLTTANEAPAPLDVPRVPSGTMPDALEVVDLSDAEIAEASQPTWALDEMDVEEIDVTFD
jgi:phosphate/phosphite/phosphonate ABC transporter binding protein